MLVYVCLYVKYNNSCSTVSKLVVSKTNSRFDRVMLLMLENKKWEENLNVATPKYFLLIINIYPSFFKKGFGILYLLTKIEHHKQFIQFCF